MKDRTKVALKEMAEEAWGVMCSILHVFALLFVAGFTLIGVAYLFYVFVHFIHPEPIFPEQMTKQECKCHD